MSLKIKSLIFYLLFFIAFYIWTENLTIGIVLLFIFDALTTKILLTYIKNKFSNKVYVVVKYLNLFIIPFLIAVVFRLFFFDIYYIPSGSMESTLSSNDYVIVNKVSYGPRIPRMSQDIPLIGFAFKNDNRTFQYDLFKAFAIIKKYKQDDIVVFKATDNNNEFYVKRIIAVSGDSLIIKNGTVIVNNTRLIENPKYVFHYIGNKNETRDFSNIQLQKNKGLQKKFKRFISKEKIFDSKNNFVSDNALNWTVDNFGPIYIPKKGDTIILNSLNYQLYKNLLINNENSSVTLRNGESKKYVFKYNYYFMLGDNRHNSIDSRYYGLIPENYIQGKVVFNFN